MNFHGLSNDELSAWYRTGFSSWEDLWYFGVTHGDMHPVFYQSLLWFWVRLFGDADWIIRIPSLLFFAGNMVLIYQISRQHFSERAAYLPLILYVGSSFLIINTTFARPYNSGSFFVLLAFFAVLEITQTTARSWKWMVILAIGFLGAMLSHYFAFVTVGVLGILSLFILDSKKRLSIVIAGVLAGIGFLPHLSVTWYQLNRGGLQWLAPPKWDWLATVWIQVMNNSFWLAVLFVPFIVYSIAKSKKEVLNTGSIRLAWMLFISVLLVGYAISYFFTPVLRELVILFILPFPLIAIGHSLQLSEVRSFVVAVALLLHSFLTDSIFDFHHFGDFKYVSKEINTIHKQLGYSSVTHACNTNNVAYLNYYIDNDLKEEIKNWDDPQAVNLLYRRVQHAKTPYFLYVLNNAYHSEQFLEVIRSCFPIQRKDLSFGNSRLVLFKRSSLVENRKYAASQGSTDEFLATSSISVDRLNKKRALFFINKSKVSGQGQVFGVVTIERDGKQLMNGDFPLLYQTFDINQNFIDNKGQGTTYLGFHLPSECKQGDIIKFYIWNPNRLTVSPGVWEYGQR